jgi:hypothetical protein
MKAIRLIIHKLHTSDGSRKLIIKLNSYTTHTAAYVKGKELRESFMCLSYSLMPSGLHSCLHISDIILRNRLVPYYKFLEVY